MIDSDFIIRYTNALYSTPAESAPRYDEFRDMFSSGQIHSKTWLVKEIGNYSAIFNKGTALIVGAWFGTLGLMLKRAYPFIDVTMLDIDPRCKTFVDNVIYNTPGMNAITGDMYTYKYTESLVVNTSCEHISDLESWISMLPNNTLVALQSNNYDSIPDHINCVYSEKELAEKSNLKDVWYQGQLSMPMYTRFMVIGRT